MHLFSLPDEFKGHSLLQAAREADLAKVKKTLALEIINFKQPQSHETALVRLFSQSICFMINVVLVLVDKFYFCTVKIDSSSKIEDLPPNNLKLNQYCRKQHHIIVHHFLFSSWWIAEALQPLFTYSLVTSLLFFFHIILISLVVCCGLSGIKFYSSSPVLP